jgi:hypothetical protein
MSKKNHRAAPAAASNAQGGPENAAGEPTPREPESPCEAADEAKLAGQPPQPAEAVAEIDPHVAVEVAASAEVAQTSTPVKATEPIEVRLVRQTVIGGIDYPAGTLLGSVILADGVSLNYLVRAVIDDFAREIHRK